MVNFAACQAAFLSNQSNLDLYSCRGPVSDVLPGDHHFITLDGCRTLCGSGSDLYPWSTSANTIVTWVLPMLVMFLLAPFESNETGNTFLSATRWIGSPFVSMWYVLSNIRVTARCAQMVDMAVPFDEVPGEGSEWSDFRDGMVILSAMNQYLLHSSLADRSERSHCAEQVLRVALFGRWDAGGCEGSLVQKRRKLAAAIRIRRRRGVVPILIRLVWFLFVLGLSINFTFSNIGDNKSAHNLALGFAVSWITPLVMGGVVDRKPTATKDLRQKFNHFFHDSRRILQTLAGREAVTHQLGRSIKSGMYEIDENILVTLPDDIFISFAGQGRLRWHRGVAHPVLTGIERSFAADFGRGWLDEGAPSTAALLIPHGTSGFGVVDLGILVQTFAAFLIIYGNIFAGFLISYYTPTVGLGCRAGGYLIFGILTFIAALGEIGMEFISAPTSSMRRLGHWSLVALEFSNVCWLLWITLAQTFGVYETCLCLSSEWDGRGGYIQFDHLGHDNASSVTMIWSIGTGIAGLILIGALMYIVTEWCEQSHLMTSDFENARRV